MQLWVPSGRGESDFTEKKSRFIGAARRARTAEEARSIVAALREEHPRSRHVVWAYVLGADGVLKGMSDDGEPRGTAGRPVLDHITGAKLTDTLVTVVRYFGGIKLGTGGLCSAYGQAARQALEAMSREPLIERRQLRLGMEYSVYDTMLRLLERFEGRVVEDSFGENVSLRAEIPAGVLNDFLAAVENASRGAAAVELIEQERG
ncbi:MAG: YigZ family protein [Spirochaetales bacterium]|nr:MAG: YigZ family protein [Spirochaetales bacterium]